ncbi:MAG: anti-sigma-D factor RsdA [Pseudonocardiaceae bacterium]
MTPVDLAAVQADDALLNALGRTDAGREDNDAELARVLVAWRRDIDTESIGQLVDIDTAVATVSAARRSATRRHPVLAPIAAAAAVLVVAFAGISLVAKSAEPGDQLFALTKVLYAQYAQSVEAAKKAETELEQAERAIAEGNTSEARRALESVEDQLPVVKDAEGHERLASEHSQLVEMLKREPDPAEPPPATTSTSPSASTSQTSLPMPPPAPSVPPSEPTTTSSVPSSTAPAPSPTSPSTLSSQTAPAEPEPAAETRSGEAAPRAGEASPPAETAPGS